MAAQDIVHVILRNALELDGDFALADDLKLQDIPELDSLGQVRLVMEIERVIDDKLSMDELLAIESVGNIRELLAARGRV